MTLEELRRQYPQYESVPDAELAEKVYEKYYASSEHSKEEVFERLGVTNGFNFGRMVSNIPESGAKFVSDIAQAVTSPVETGKAVAGLAGDVLTGNYAQEVGRAVSGQEPTQTLPGAVHQGVKQRYGTPQAALTTLETDPVGVLADVAGGTAFSGAKAGRAIEPVRAATKPVRAAAKAAIPETKATKLYQKAAKFSTTMDESKRQKIIQTALDEGLMPTNKGVRKVEGRLEVLNAALDDLIETATDAGAAVPTREVMLPLKELRKSKGGFKIEAADDLKFIDDFERRFVKAFEDKIYVTPKELQAFKVDAYKKINWDAKRMTGSPIKEDTFKAFARGAKNAISKNIPEADDINRVLGDLYELQPHLGRSAGRIENRNPVGLTTPINIGAGGYVGSAAGSPALGYIAGTAAAVLNNPRMQARLAIALNKIKKGDVGWIEANRGAAEVRLALDMVGRLNDQQASQ